MKRTTKKLIFIPVIIGLLLLLSAFAIDIYLMPWYVDAPEYSTPDVVGLQKDEAVLKLQEMNLNPVLEGPRYNSKVPKDHILYQRPRAGSIVKENRRVYIFISGGESLVKMPQLEGKTFRDAAITIERLGLSLGNIDKMRSEIPADRVVEQDQAAGSNVARGQRINLKLSLGPYIGKIRVPNLLGKSFTNAKGLLQDNSLNVGRINYIESKNLVPNTIYQQYPTENKLVVVGDSIDIWLTKNSLN